MDGPEKFELEYVSVLLILIGYGCWPCDSKNAWVFAESLSDTFKPSWFAINVVVNK